MNRRKTGAGPAKDHSVTDGHVRWTYIDNLCIPCIIREGKPHGPVRILEKELLNRLSSIDAVNAAFQNRQLLVSKYLTDVEVMQLNHFSAGTFGVFTSKDLVVDIQEFRELYSYVKSVLHRPNSVVTGGWVQVNNSVIPYINVNQSKLLPLPVVTNAAGLLCNVSSRLLRLTAPSKAQCQYFNELCTSAGLEFTFDTNTLLVDINVMCAMTIPTPYTRELPSNDPFNHANFIDESLLGTLASTPAVQSYQISNTVVPHDVLLAQSAGHALSQPPNVLPTYQPSQMMQHVNGPVVSNSAPTVIESVPFRGRTISSLRHASDGNHYVLLEAVCRVFFPHQSDVKAFIRAAETLVKSPAIVHMSADEEQQFIGFYKLPIDRLRYNKLIRLDQLTEIFPRLEVLFPAAEAIVGGGQLIGTLIPRRPGDSGASADGQTPPTTTTTNNNDNDDITRPRKRRRNNVFSDVVVID